VAALIAITCCGSLGQPLENCTEPTSQDKESHRSSEFGRQIQLEKFDKETYVQIGTVQS